MVKGGLYAAVKASGSLTSIDVKMLVENQKHMFNKQLEELGFKKEKLSNKVLKVLKMAEEDMNLNIYHQCMLEEVKATKEQVYLQIELGASKGLDDIDVQKINNLKFAWSFLIQEEVAQIPSCFGILISLANFVNASLFEKPGELRNSDVRIGGSSYVPPLPDKEQIIKDIEDIISLKKTNVDIAIELCLYIMKSQIFIDGNKRVAVLFANHYLMHKGAGLMIITDSNVRKFKSMLVDYYEDKDTKTIKNFLKEECFYTYKNIAI